MDELLHKYVERFEQNFPIFMMMGESDDVVADIIKKCLDDGKPYDAEAIDGALY